MRGHVRPLRPVRLQLGILGGHLRGLGLIRLGLGLSLYLAGYPGHLSRARGRSCLS